jgi:outer membrane protein, heavy metal efflux system
MLRHIVHALRELAIRRFMLAGAGFCAIANAAPAQGTRPITLGDVYQAVSSRNPQLEAARAQARAAAARVPRASLPMDPELQLGVMNYSLSSLAPMATLGMTQLQLMQSVPLGGKLRAAGRVANAEANAASSRAVDAVWEVRSRAANAFYDAFEAQASLATMREALRLLRDIEHTSESMYRVGEGRQADVLRAQVEVARMEADTARMRAMRTAALARLEALSGDSSSAMYSGANISIAIPRFPVALPAQDSLVALALVGRPMLLAGASEVQAAREGERLAAAERYPDLQVGVQVGQRGTEMGTERMGSLMVGASVPLFGRRRQSAMREESSAMRAMAAADLAWQRSDTRARISEVYADLVRARTLELLYRTSVLPQAEAAAQSALAAYRGGSVDFMTLLDDRMTVNRYRQELLALSAEEGKAWAELEMLTGRELLDANVIGEPLAVGER